MEPDRPADYLAVAGELVVVGDEPDGNSIRFRAADQNLWRRIEERRRPVRLAPDGTDGQSFSSLRTTWGNFADTNAVNRTCDVKGFLRIFCEHCELLAIRWTQSNPRNISISHRTSVALMDEFIGPKW